MTAGNTTGCAAAKQRLAQGRPLVPIQVLIIAELSLAKKRYALCWSSKTSAPSKFSGGWKAE
jgi:hypothetical protein